MSERSQRRPSLPQWGSESGHNRTMSKDRTDLVRRASQSESTLEKGTNSTSHARRPSNSASSQRQGVHESGLPLLVFIRDMNAPVLVSLESTTTAGDLLSQMHLQGKLPALFPYGEYGVWEVVGEFGLGQQSFCLPAYSLIPFRAAHPRFRELDSYLRQVDSRQGSNWTQQLSLEASPRLSAD